MSQRGATFPQVVHNQRAAVQWIKLYTVGPKKLEHGLRTIYAGDPGSLGLSHTGP